MSCAAAAHGLSTIDNGQWGLAAFPFSFPVVYCPFAIIHFQSSMSTQTVSIDSPAFVPADAQWKTADGK
jgi:hypothetical protein